MTLAWVLLFAFAFIGVYWFSIRPWLRSIPSLADEWEAIDRFEEKLWLRSRTILLAILIGGSSFLITIHDFIATISVDWTPITSTLLGYIPEKYRPMVMPIVMSVLASLFAYMRKITTEPLNAKKEP